MAVSIEASIPVYPSRMAKVILWLLIAVGCLGTATFAQEEEEAVVSLLRPDGACAVANMFPYTIGHGRWPPTAFQQLSFSWAASAQMAMDHFNARDTSVIPELQTLAPSNGECSVYFSPPTVLDSAQEGPTAVKALWTATTSTIQQQQQPQQHTSNDTLASSYCAVLGPMDPRATEEVAAITTALGLPHLFYYTESNRFWNTGLDGNTVGMPLSPHSRAHIMLQWLTEHQREYLAVLHYPKDGSSDLAEELFSVANNPDEYYHKEIIVQNFLRVLGPGQVPILLNQVQESAITTILLNFDNPRAILSLANGLADAGMLTDKYLYIMSPDAIPTDQRLQDVYGHDNYPAGSNVDRLLSYSIVFDVIDPFRVDDQDNFLQAWNELDSDMVHRINAQNPLSPTSPSYFEAPTDYFQTQTPNHHSSYIYDAVMMLGIAACQLQMQNATLDLQTMIPHIHNMSSFQSASGRISPFPYDTAYRNPNTDFEVGLYNILPATTALGNRTYTASLVSIWSDGAWNDVPNVSLLYRDGTTTPPPSLSYMDNNYLSTSVRAIGFSVMALTWFIVIGAMVAIVSLRFTNTIQRAQPFFLLLLCMGSLLTSFAIFTLSWDENTGATQAQLDLACGTTPWAFFLGQIITFMALFSALWRLDRVLQFRRRNKVSVRQVLGPLLVLLGMTLILLTLWTVLDPWTWQREWIRRVPAETYGACTCDNVWAFFGPLMALIVVSEALAAFFAWRTSDVPEDFSDSRTVVLAICFHVQSWLIGVPILGVLQDSSANATYLARVLVIWIFAISSVLVVVGPRIYRAQFVEGREGVVGRSRIRSSMSASANDRNSARVHISGINVPSGPLGVRREEDSSTMSPPLPTVPRGARRDPTSSICSTNPDPSANAFEPIAEEEEDEPVSKALTKETVDASELMQTECGKEEGDDRDEFACE
ncbi:Gamma-aminobutyric acid (GABA) B receptor [Seminavis robusta]|uniref:Gamma-aminobutyric acid (GABA) B receptor n=1 Tax=Seminavis robusta TaxID=568900 RepID=A0A9N8HPK4_9STRA|nr:Gamma-aminobutyric acid (GABA) B receptor [Seminavis robusta]|eukprot:Sro1187_g250480.1 Gamma-aminobutyric acid (GABA) B receptor (934) ;mRNA; r:13529-16449